MSDIIDPIAAEQGIIDPVTNTGGLTIVTNYQGWRVPYAWRLLVDATGEILAQGNLPVDKAACTTAILAYRTRV